MAGIVPGLILIVFMGVFALYTAKLLIDFKVNHPEVHNMGDAGYILFGAIGREVLSAGTIIFAICATVGTSSSPESHSVLTDGKTGLRTIVGSTSALHAVKQWAVRDLPGLDFCYRFPPHCTPTHTGSTELARSCQRSDDLSGWNRCHGWCVSSASQRTRG
jgi:hypothetical protein